MKKRTTDAAKVSFIFAMIGAIAVLVELAVFKPPTLPIAPFALLTISGVCAVLVVSVSKKYENAAFAGLVVALVVIGATTGWGEWSASSFQTSHSIIETGTVTNAFWWNQGSGNSYEMVENLTISLHGGNVTSLYLTCNYYRIGSNITLQMFPSRQPGVVDAPSGCSVTGK